MSTDGRNVDPELGILEGEGASQRVQGPPGREFPTLLPAHRNKPAEARAPSRSERPDLESPEKRLESTTYYDQPVLKEPVWKPTIPLYFYVGGVAGSALALAGAVSFTNSGDLRRLARTCRRLAFVGAGLSAALLIEDLGRRERFQYMLRVFRPTSPMNVGAWILTGFGAAATGALLFEGRKIGRICDLAGAVAGLGLVSYTGVLLANTAVPSWQHAHRTLPVLFTASGATGLASLLECLEFEGPERKVVWHFAVATKAAELVAAHAMVRELREKPRAALPYEHGLSGTLWKTAKFAVAKSLALSVLSAVVPSLRRPAGVLGTLGSIALRFGVFRAGVRSSRDPRATFEGQRAP